MSRTGHADQDKGKTASGQVRRRYRVSTVIFRVSVMPPAVRR